MYYTYFRSRYVCIYKLISTYIIKVIKGLTNVELFFLPPNTTSKIQPFNVGIIRALKIHYHFDSSILEGFEERATNPEKINTLNDMKFINAVWNIEDNNHCTLFSTMQDPFRSRYGF